MADPWYARLNNWMAETWPWRIVWWWLHAFKDTYGKGRWWRKGGHRQSLYISWRMANVCARGAAIRKTRVITPVRRT